MTHDPKSCDDGGCQDEDCIDYWETLGKDMYGDTDPSQ